jgi:hypothetical protein
VPHSCSNSKAIWTASKCPLTDFEEVSSPRIAVGLSDKPEMISTMTDALLQDLRIADTVPLKDDEVLHTVNLDRTGRLT